MKRRTILLLCAGIIILVAGIIYAKIKRGQITINESFQQQLNNTTKPTIIHQQQPITDYLYAGYNDIYDYIISSELLDLLKQHEAFIKPTSSSNNTKPTDILNEDLIFADIPRIYIYITKDQPTKANIILSKLKKSPDLIKLANGQLKVITETPIPDKDKTLNMLEGATRNSVDPAIYSKLVSLIKKHNIAGLPGTKLAKHLPAIKTYIKYKTMLEPGFMSNIQLTPTERILLNIPDTEQLPSSSIPGLSMNPDYSMFITAKTKANNPEPRFTTLLDDVNQYNFITREDMIMHMTQDADKELQHSIKKFLFQNPELGINIKLDKRIAKFQLDMINPYQADLFYILADNLGDTELTNKEIKAKHALILTEDLSPDSLEKLKMQTALNPDKPVTYNPDRYFYLFYNAFQIIRINIKREPYALGY